MKKLLLGAFILLSLAAIVSCGLLGGYESVKEIDKGKKLEWGDTEYLYHDFLTDFTLKGEQIAIVDGDDMYKIFEVVGYDKSEWIIKYYDKAMSRHMLYRASTVKEIPPEFQPK